MHSDQDTEDTAQAVPPSAEAADPLELDTGESHLSAMVDQENDRLVTSFVDFFVAIGVSVVLAVASLVAYGVWEHLLAAGTVAAAISWVVTATLAHKKRMAFTSTMLLFALLAGVGISIFDILTTAGFEDDSLAFALLPVVVALAARLHWRLYRVPAAVAAGIGAFVAAVIYGLYVALAGAGMVMLPAILLSGIAVFAYAIYWDLSDTDLHTHRNDVAFWLHLLAATLLATPLFILAVTWGQSESGAFTSAYPGSLHLTICAIALAVNRRVLLVSATTSMFVVTTLIIAEGDASFGLLITVLGQVVIAILVLVFWKWARSRLLDFFKMPETWRQRLPGNTR